MVSDKVAAASVSALMLEMGAKLGASVALVQECCSPEEFKVYRRAIGKVMAEMLLEIMNPLYAAHPDIKPKELH